MHFWFWTRYMPATGSVKPFAGIISFLSNIDGSPDWTWTSDTLINSFPRAQGHTKRIMNPACMLVCPCFVLSMNLSITLERSGRMLENAHACSKLCWKLAGLSNFHAERLETLLPLCCACGRGSKVFNGSVWIWRRPCSFQWSYSTTEFFWF